MADVKDSRGGLLELARTKAKQAVKGGISEVAKKDLAPPDLWFSTGSLALDRICRGVNPGGLPSRRVIHIPGEWSTGKSLLLDHVFRSCIEMGGLALCSETEGTRDKHFADAIGLNLDFLEIQRPDTIEEMIDMGLAWHDAIRGKPHGKRIPVVWGVDSLDSSEADKAAKAGLSESHGWQYGGGKSEALGAGLRKVIKRTSRYPTTFVMLNQVRENIGVKFGPAKRPSGGEPPHFYAGLEIMLSVSPLGVERGPANSLKLTPEARKRLGLRVTDQGDVIGRWIMARITKTKVGLTWDHWTNFYLDFRKGVHRWGGLKGLLLRQGVVSTDSDGVTVIHGDHEFPDESSWLGWLAKHPEELSLKEKV